MANTLITPIIPDILDGLEVGRGQAGLLVSAATLPGILLAPVIGVLADRYGRREILVPCLLLFALAGGLGAIAPSFGVLLLLRFFQGAASAGLINLVVVIIGDHWSGADRARMIGRNSAVLTVCLALFPTIAGALADLGSWRTPFLLYPVAVLTAVAAFRVLPTGVRREVSIADQLRDVVPILRQPRMLAMMAATVVVFALIFGILLTLLPIYLEERFGLGATARGIVLGLPALGSTTAALTLARVTQRMGRRRVLLLAAALITAALVVVAGAGFLPAVIVGIILFGLGEGITIPSLQDIAASAGDTETRGAVVASQVSVARMGQTIGPVTASTAMAALGAVPTFIGGAVIGLVLLAPLLGASAAGRVRTLPGQSA